MSEKNKGHYGLFLIRGSQVGGFLYWNIDKNSPTTYCTSNWWIFRDIKTCVASFYIMQKDGLKELYEKTIKLDYSYNIELHKWNKGVLKMIVY